MPFLNLDDEQEPRPALRQVEPNRFELVTGFRYRDPTTGTTYTVPAHGASVGGSTDIASVPWFLWTLMASHGRQTLPALLHDHLCERARQAPPAEREPLRREGDRLFRVSLGEQGVGALKQGLFWTAVSWDRFMEFAKPRGVLLALQCAGSALLLLGSCFVLDGWATVLAMLAPAVVSLAWRRDAAVAAIGSYAAPLIVPVAAVNLAAAAVLWVAGHAVHGVLRLTGRASRRPSFTPFRLPSRGR